MKKEKNFALLIDIDNLPLGVDNVQSIMDQVKVKGDIAYGKFYGYSERKHKGLLDIINKTGFDSAGRAKSKKSSKSVLDYRMFIDAVEIACINENIDSICIVAGDGDLVPLFAKLRELGMYIVGGFNENEDNADMCHELVYLDPAATVINIPKPEMAKPQFVPLRERMAQRGEMRYMPPEREDERQVVTRLGSPVEAEKAIDRAEQRNSDMFNEIERLVQDYMKDNEN
jgi:hypothetical protein